MPITFPFPVRVSVGLVAAGVEHLRSLPGDLPTMGVTVAGQAMRLSMRVQQELAELATRGDEVLTRFGGGPAEHPSWATFDEETDGDGSATTVVTVVEVAEADPASTRAAEADEDADEDGYAGDAASELAEVIALDLVAAHRAAASADETVEASADESSDAAPTEAAPAELDATDTAPPGSPASDSESHGPDPTTNGATDGSPDYDSLSLAELRGKLRRLSPEEVTALLDRERAGADRPAFVTLLTNRLTSLEQGHP